MPIIQLFTFLPLLVPLLYYGLIFFCILKLYRMLSSINDNLAAINRSIAAGSSGLAGRSSPLPALRSERDPDGPG